MKTKLMRRTMAIMLSAALAAGPCISSVAADNETASVAGMTEVSENEESRPDRPADGVQGDFL